jgi:pimeloyl-ACP methyl ester carboxylesterase
MDRMTIDIPESALDDLRTRLRLTRWPQHLRDVGWSYGTDPDYLRELVRYWLEEYDWPAEQSRLAAQEHHRPIVDGLGVHFVRHAGTGPDPMPLLLLHGWPGSFVQMLDLAPMLADPAAHGADPADSFEVITGSLPGFGFSEAASEPGISDARMAEMFDRLMVDVLGHDRYAVHGSDFGAGVANQLAARHREHVIGIHVSGTSPRADVVTADDPPEVQQYAEDVARWRATEVGYSVLQSTKPQTLATALNDSPAGLASWIVEKFRRWSDCGGDVERRFSKDQLLTNVMIYWLTGTIGSSIRLYHEAADDPDLRDSVVPVAHLLSDRDMLHTPRAWIERSDRIDHWTQVDRGGHFLEWEEPELVAGDIRAFFGTLRGARPGTVG